MNFEGKIDDEIERELANWRKIRKSLDVVADVLGFILLVQIMLTGDAILMVLLLLLLFLRILLSLGKGLVMLVDLMMVVLALRLIFNGGFLSLTGVLLVLVLIVQFVLCAPKIKTMEDELEERRKNNTDR